MNDEFNYEEITRDQYAIFLDVTPSAESESYKLLGFGVTEGTINYNPQIKTQKWITKKNATSLHDSNQKQMDITQYCFKGEPCFEYLNKLRDKSGKIVKSHAIEVDLFNGTEDTNGVMKYPAKKSDCITPITTFMSSEATIGYSIYFNGDPVEGTVTISNGVPTFTENA